MDVVGLGAGGHAKGVIEILRALPDFCIVGLLDVQPRLHHTDVLGVRVLGGDEWLARLHDQGVRHAFVGVGTAISTHPRAKIYDRLVRHDFEVISAIHPSAVVSPSARLGQGTTLMAGSVVNASAWIGDNVIVNTGAIVEHDCRLGDHVHLATGARLAGGVQLGVGALVGVGACVRPGISIGSRAVVGAGAVVVQDVPDDVVVAGVPARILCERTV
jgi:UDP-perosamine 4-acetyltransferase